MVKWQVIDTVYIFFLFQQITIMEVTEILLIPATIIASVVLVASCLLLKKLRGKARYIHE